MAFRGALSLSQDITARLQAEKALHLRDSAIQAATQGVMSANVSQADTPIILVSPGFERTALA